MRELINRVKNDDVSAVEELYQQVYATGMKVAVSYVGKEGLEEDMFHEAFIKAVQNIDKFDETRPFQAWFDVIVANTCKSYLRKKKAELVQPSEDGEETEEFLKEISDMGNPEDCWDQQEVHQIINGMLDELSKEQKEAVILHYYQNMPVAQIAEYQACSVDTVKSRLFQARNKLKAAVETYEKKTNTKLHAIGITVALFLFFKSGMGKAYACEMDIKAQITRGEYKMKDGVKAEGMKLSTKVAIGVVAAGLIAGIAAWGVSNTEGKVASSGNNQTSEEVVAESVSSEMTEESSSAESYEVVYKVSKRTSAFVDEGFMADCIAGVKDCGMNQITPGWACTEFYTENQRALADGSMHGLQYFEVNGIADISQVTEYTYDESGNLVGAVVSGRDPFEFAYSGNLGAETVSIEYDEVGNVIRRDDGEYGYEYSYDKNGNLIKEAYLNSWSNEYVYDESGNVIKEIYTDVSWGEPYITETNYEYTFDDAGNVVLKTSHITDPYFDSTSSVGYSYDEAGNVVQEISYDSEGNKNDSTEYVYDENGNMVQEIYYDSDGNIGRIEEYVYDENGNKIKTITIAGYSLTSVEHTINGLFVKSELQGDGGFPEVANPSGDWRTTIYLGGCVPVYYSYSENNQVQSEVGKNISFYDALSCVCEYDDAGNVEKEIWCNTDGTPVVETTYEYEEVKVLVQ